MTITIEHSLGTDLDTILCWLKKEYDADDDGKGFWNNRNRIQEAHRKKRLYVLRENDKCVAFHFKSDIMGVLEVHPDKRGNGYGHMLAERWIASERKKDAVYVAVECAPETSLPFWQTMGFTVTDTEQRLYAHRVLNKRFTLDDGAELVDVKIAFYPPGAEHVKKIRPLSKHRPEAVRDGNNIKLAERVICLQPFDDGLVVKIQVDSKTLYFGKVRHPQAQALGIQRYKKDYFTAYYCDYLIPSGSAPVQ
jgi:hypothetical protein